MAPIPTPVWMNCDPGHDDAFALLLATMSPEVNLIGVSIVHGNDEVRHCGLNAKRFLWTCGVKGVKVYLGVERPLIREPKYCPEIHGTPGEQGVSGMCGYHFPEEEIFSNPEYNLDPGHGVIMMKEAIMNHPTKVTLVATGAQTNIALAIRMFPELKNKIEKIVFMGGAIGVGNTGVAAEFNIEIDPEAAHIVLHSGIPLVMIPLEVTHSILVTDEILDQIKHIKSWAGSSGAGEEDSANSIEAPHPHVEYTEISRRIQDALNLQDNPTSSSSTKTMSEAHPTPFADCCFKLLSFFKGTYRECFSFASPPLHDPATIFYITNPEAFQTLPMFVDVETSGQKCVGRTLCDLHGVLKREPNVTVCTAVNVQEFWNKMLTCIKAANDQSPLNIQ